MQIAEKKNGSMLVRSYVYIIHIFIVIILGKYYIFLIHNYYIHIFNLQCNITTIKLQTAEY